MANQHFKDARHHVERAAETARRGVEQELDELEGRVRELVGMETEPEPSRVEQLQADLREFESRVTGETRQAVEAARKRLQDYLDAR